MVLITWDDLDGFTWDELGKMKLTWDDLEKMTVEELSEVATLRLSYFRVKNNAERIENPKIILQIENLYIMTEPIYPQAVPQKDRLSAKAIELFASSLISLAVSQAFEHREELAEILRRVICVLSQIAPFQ